MQGAEAGGVTRVVLGGGVAPQRGTDAVAGAATTNDAPLRLGSPASLTHLRQVAPAQVPAEVASSSEVGALGATVEVPSDAPIKSGVLQAMPVVAQGFEPPLR